jgi:hypothetical protein
MVTHRSAIVRERQREEPSLVTEGDSVPNGGYRMSRDRQVVEFRFQTTSGGKAAH